MILLSKRQPEAGNAASSLPTSPPDDPPSRQPSRRSLDGRWAAGRSSDGRSATGPDRRRRVRRWAVRLLLVVCAAWLFVACNPGQDRVQSYLGVTIADASIGEYVEGRRQELGIPGLTLAIINDREVVYAETFGHADVEAGLPVTERTIFEGASLSKPVFAHFVMTFVEEGALDLDRPLHQYLPHPDVGSDRRAQRITARMVLSHQGGFPNWRDEQGDGSLPIDFEPGTDYQYSGEGYQYLAMVLLQIADTDWAGLERLFQLRIAEPLGLERTVFIQTPVTRRHKAAPYDENGVKIDWRNQPSSVAGTGSRPDPEAFVAPASLHTDAADFSRWMVAVMNRELLTAGSYQELFRPHSSTSPDGIELSYTLGFYNLQVPFTDLYGHDGNNDGFTSSFMLDAEDGWGFVLFSNSEYGQALGEDLFGQLIVGPSIPRAIATIVAAGILAVSVLVAGVRVLWRLVRRRSDRPDSGHDRRLPTAEPDGPSILSAG